MKPKGGGLLIALGGAGPKKLEASKKSPFGGGDEEPEEEADETSDMDSYLEDAFDALQDGDKESFKLALKGALECM